MLTKADTSLVEISPGETDQPRIIYFPGFGGSNLTESRHEFLIDLSNKTECEVLQVSRSGSDFSLIANVNAADKLLSELRALIKEVQQKMFFVSDCFAAGVVLDLAEEFSDDVLRTILVSPPVNDFEKSFKRLFQQHPDSRARAQTERQWKNLNERGNRSGFDLKNKDCSQSHAVYLTGDTVIFPPEALRTEERVFESGSVGHRDWEKCPGLPEHIVEIIKNYYPEKI